ncbi:MAG: hypothetical protein Q8R28_18230, partial [Dehalococcoidia bacterium]|nr:hypothetical protein [Dehalococcoidia bacterium]
MSLRDKRYPRPEEESRRRRVRLGAPHHAGPVDAARRDKPVADLEEQFSELGVELRTARERLAHYESFSSATIAVLDRRMRQLVADLEKTLQELAGLKEDSEKRIAALEEENLSLHRAGGDARNESPGEISEVERKTPEIDIDAGGGPEIKPRSASPLDFLFRRHDEP